VNNWDEANEILAGGGRSAKFPEIGTSYAGEVLDVRVTDQTNFDTGAVETWADGRPKKMLIVSLQTKIQEDDDDDGVRTIYAKGGIYTAIRDAVRKTGIAPGGKLAVKYDSNGTPSKKGFNPPKIYKARYEPPAAVAVSLEEEEALPFE
jgi:hypothetical protein